MKNQLLRSLTILVPTFNRPTYILRQIRYWEGKETQIIVLDGSENALPKAYLSNLASNIQYKHMPISLEDRMAIGASCIKTKYGMFCADDEFMIPSGLSACMSFLEKNSDFSVAIGRCIAFLPEGSEIKMHLAKERHQFHKVNQDSVEERVFYHISNYEVTTFYGVHRAEHFVSNIKNCTVSYGNAYVPEFIFEACSVAQGKSMVLSKPSWLRSGENPPVSIDGFNRDESFISWFNNPSNLTKTELLVDQLVDVMLQVDSSKSKKYYNKIVKESIECHFEKLKHLIELKRQSRFYRTRLWVKRFVPMRIKLSLKQVRNRFLMHQESFWESNLKYNFKSLAVIGKIEFPADIISDLNEIFEHILRSK